MERYKYWVIFVCIVIVFCSDVLCSDAEAPTQPIVLTLEQTNDILTQNDIKQEITPEQISAPIAEIAQQNTENNSLIQINKESDDSLIEAKQEKRHFFDALSEDNIFDRKEFKKTFETGIIKDIKLVGGHNMVYQGWRQSNGISHNWIDDRISLWGVQGHLRDNTLFNFTMLPIMENMPNYPHFSNNLFEYYLKKDITKHESLTVGQQRTPNTLEGCRSVFGLPIGRRAQLGNTYSNICSIGAKVSGDYDRVEYQAGIFDAGRFMKDVFDYQPEFATLVSFKPIKNTAKYGKLKVGGSYNGGRRDFAYNVYSAHALYDYKKAHVDFEYAFANGYSSRTISRNKSDSFYTTFIYKLSPRWEPFIRVDTLNANTQLSGQRNTEYTIGTHYYLKGKKTRLTLSYIYANHESKPDSNKLFTMIELLL